MGRRKKKPPVPPTPLKKVMIVNGSADILELFESVLDPGHYDAIFVEESKHAYSQIRLHKPDLVILCLRIEDKDGFQVLSMLKLDPETAGIPVLTYTTEFEGQELSYETNSNENDGQLPLPGLRYRVPSTN